LLLNNRRRAYLNFCIFCQKVLHLEIQFARWSEEERENW
jgi:hypothetical protein